MLNEENEKKEDKAGISDYFILALCFIIVVYCLIYSIYLAFGISIIRFDLLYEYFIYIHLLIATVIIIIVEYYADNKEFIIIGAPLFYFFFGYFYTLCLFYKGNTSNKENKENWNLNNEIKIH